MRNHLYSPMLICVHAYIRTFACTYICICACTAGTHPATRTHGRTRSYASQPCRCAAYRYRLTSTRLSGVIHVLHSSEIRHEFSNPAWSTPSALQASTTPLNASVLGADRGRLLGRLYHPRPRPRRCHHARPAQAIRFSPTGCRRY